MNKIGLVIAVVGVVICLIGAALFVASGDSFSEIEESQKYEGKDGEMKLEGYAEGGWLIVTMEGNYTNERSAIINGSASLTDEDCDLISNFTLTGENGDEYFIPTCDNPDDTTEDGWVHIGVICDSKGRYSNQSKGCPDGNYTWDTNGTLINVWDGEQIIEGLISGLTALGSGLFACCCGVVVLILGIALAFLLQDDKDAQQYATQNTDHALLKNDQEDGFKPYEKSGWDEQEDYIRKEKKVDETEEVKEEESKPEEDSAEKKRSGEYELPPPPEY